MASDTLTAKVDFLVREARLDADAFRENTIYNGDGDAIRLIANAERLEQYAETMEAQATRIEALEDALRECIDVMEPLAKYPNVNPWLIQAKAALEGKTHD